MFVVPGEDVSLEKVHGPMEKEVGTPSLVETSRPPPGNRWNMINQHLGLHPVISIRIEWAISMLIPQSYCVLSKTGAHHLIIKRVESKSK